MRIELPIPLETLREEARKVERIYYSANTLWWTHRPEDVEEATRHGREALIQRQQQQMQRMPAEQAGRARALFKLAMEHPIPMDPTGSPLMQMDDPAKWVEGSITNADHFGKHGALAFAVTHHLNCAGFIFTTWEGANAFIDCGCNRDAFYRTWDGHPVK